MPGMKMGHPRGRGPEPPPASPPGSGEESSWPTGVASWTRDFLPLTPLLPCSREFHPLEPPPE
ncbi:Hypothetical protein AA314_00695 [Archangium gephyra]|uniref:Uncharacterized protein n=1 Tax=Archangium gephyra TaxID=48 RepID=A0AAC8Q146_9BACT|nr:Hypothetical protein AA314_00695 [Archangium gephyra]